MRIALGIEYDGSQFHGWQKQKHQAETVQQKLEHAVGFVANHAVSIVCAGRTDSGVHGVGQVVHFDTDSQRDSKAWVYGGNAKLPDTIAIKWAKVMPDDFHARFSAMARSYRYAIYNHPIRPGIGMSHLTWNYRPLDLEAMIAASRCLIGEHDFSSFRAVDCQSKSPVRSLMSLNLYRKDRLIVMDIKANAFLQHMVRNIAGTLMAVGSGKMPVEWVEEVLHYRDRTKGGVTAPPYGLYFMAVDYPAQFQLPETEQNVPFMPI
ncbi:MAG: tRNA pseudouridine(38-40) synthase TruA [Pseudomonadales bacterium]|nr:tRNA pseudouridine(38-40) synthase TruA [Pseudomonadales bacterium]